MQNRCFVAFNLKADTVFLAKKVAMTTLQESTAKFIGKGNGRTPKTLAKAVKNLDKLHAPFLKILNFKYFFWKSGLDFALHVSY